MRNYFNKKECATLILRISDEDIADARKELDEYGRIIGKDLFSVVLAKRGLTVKFAGGWVYFMCGGTEIGHFWSDPLRKLAHVWPKHQHIKPKEITFIDPFTPPLTCGHIVI